MNWGTRIFITFVIFMGIIITMVVISMRQDVSLVAPDYYKQEIAYQDQINKQQNAVDDDQFNFRYIAKDMSFVITSKTNSTGEAHFYRPSDASKDVKISFETSKNQAKTISTKGMQKGLWKVKLSWKENNIDYYTEKTIVI